MITDLADPAMKAAEQEMWLVLMGTGFLTLHEADRWAPGLALAVVNAYLGAEQRTTPATPH